MGKIVAVLGFCLSGWVTAAGAAEAVPRACKSNPTMTLSDYLARGEYHVWPTGIVDEGKSLPPGEYRKLVPRDLKIENGVKHYYASDGAARSYQVPIDDRTWMANGGTRFLGEIVSPCRVQDTAGRWWVVEDGFDELGVLQRRQGAGNASLAKNGGLA